ncbi:FliH/SctL family protein [Paenibacillus sp. IHBB 10380]|uniref:FliH/SctL family protein n=1 Tax=Paenibacillus sp. IHBB 10380 TaxID=1566358 RepID=UPI0005CFA68E|nr:FliH/SctL family protein [Paenibacillus sp. IHBB 10380]AJS59171.1 flagellar biosynthesis protein [Paenibacillus sp. IHBB 10380]
MSNLIKNSQYVPIEVLKELDLARQYITSEAEPQEEIEEEVEPTVIQVDVETERLKREMLQDAQEFAERQIRESSDEAERVLSAAKETIEQWWVERREQDEHLIEALKSEGFEQGYNEGRVKAEEELRLKVEVMMDEAQSVLEEAYQTKNQIIQEAEPFLVELSTSIAEKVIDKQLTLESDYMIDLIRRSLSRKREQGVITLCVSPSHYSFVEAAREELSLAVDSQAELKIIPDATVKDRGCVIRSSFGSVDARIDTQLTEIKKELVRIALDNEERGNQDEGA